MQHYVQLQIQHFRTCINEILQSNTLHDFVQKYNTFINTTQNLKNSNFLNNDLSVVSNYVVEQFIFKKQEIIQHIEKSLEYKLNVKCKDEVEQLIKKNLQEHISKIQSLDDLRSSNFNISYN